jgi:arabinofuranosyltransferase
MQTHSPVHTLVQRAAPWVFAILLLHHAIHYAWIAEDAFINFRVVSNVLHHHLPNWNLSERVQVYTSPLWMALSVAVTAVQGDPIESTIWLSFGVFTAAMLLLWRASGQHVLLWLLMATAWCSSRSVRDYICSGLEPPLVMAAVGAAVTLPHIWPRLGPRGMGQLLAWCLLVRHDMALLVGPLLLHAAWQRQAAHMAPDTKLLRRLARLMKDLSIGAWPLLAWTAWSWLYYGSPVPNTALAKMVQGWNASLQAWHYYGFMQHFDPQLLSLMIASLTVAWLCRSALLWPTVLGLALFTAYLVHIGGDYMAGRFMVGPLTLCVFVATHALATLLDSASEAPLGWVGTTRTRTAGIVATLLSFGTATWFPENLWTLLEVPALLHDVVDTRQGLVGITDLHTLSTQGVPRTPIFRRNADAIAQAVRTQGDGAPPSAFITCALGMTGYFSPPEAHIVDPLALSDRFLAGLPVSTAHYPHIGHFERPVPHDYVSSLLSGRNAFTDPVLAAYYDDVQQVLRGPLWASTRLAAIWRLSTGAYKARLATVGLTDGGGALKLDAGPEEALQHGCLGVKTSVAHAQMKDGRLTLTPLWPPAH